MSVALDLLLNNAIAQTLIAVVLGFLGWKASGMLQKRQGRKDERAKQESQDAAAAADIHKRGADANRLRRKPSGRGSRD